MFQANPQTEWTETLTAQTPDGDTVEEIITTSDSVTNITTIDQGCIMLDHKRVGTFATLALTPLN